MAKHWDSFLSYCRSAPVQPANSRTTTDMPTSNTNKLCITLVVDYSNGKIRKDDTIKHILEEFCESDVHKSVTPVQVQTVVSAYIGMLNQAESAQEIAALWGRGARQGWNNIAQEKQRVSPDSVVPQPKGARAVIEYRTNEVQGTADLDMSPGRKGANESIFAWARDED